MLRAFANLLVLDTEEICLFKGLETEEVVVEISVVVDAGVNSVGVSYYYIVNSLFKQRCRSVAGVNESEQLFSNKSHIRKSAFVKLSD